MIEICPPYTDDQLADFARNIEGPPREGYPDYEGRLFMTPDEIDQRLDGNVLWLPAGHDALWSPNRANAPVEVQATFDPEIVTGGSGLLELSARFAGHLVCDQHGRPVHPGFRQLLSLVSARGDRLGMPTGIGAFYYYGDNGVADNAGMYRKDSNGEDETLLVRRPGTPQSPRGGWATPGGYNERVDALTGGNPAIACARRETFEETGITPRGRGVVVVRKLPISSVHTLNAWTETYAVVFPDEDQEYLHDTPPVAGPEVEDVGWFAVKQILAGDVEMWSSDHVLYIREGHRLHGGR